MVLEVGDFDEFSDDGGVCWVGSGGWRVFVSEVFEEIFVYGIELVCSLFVAGIRVSQVGYPLRDGHKGVSHCLRADRVIGASFLAVAQAVGEEPAESVFLFRDSTEARVLAFGLAELGP